MQGIEQVAGTVADQAQPVAQRTAKFLKEQAPVVAENAEPTAARASEIAEGVAHEVRCLIAARAQPACSRTGYMRVLLYNCLFQVPVYEERLALLTCLQWKLPGPAHELRPVALSCMHTCRGMHMFAYAVPPAAHAEQGGHAGRSAPGALHSALLMRLCSS